MGIGCSQHGRHIERIGFGLERHLAHGHIVDGSRHRIHAVSGGYGYHIVDTWLAKYAETEVDGLVAAVAHEHLFGRDALELCYLALQRLLVWVGVAVDAIVVRAFVGIEPY